MIANSIIINSIVNISTHFPLWMAAFPWPGPAALPRAELNMGIVGVDGEGICDIELDNDNEMEISQAIKAGVTLVKVSFTTGVNAD